jgi:hypothetical protein
MGPVILSCFLVLIFSTATAYAGEIRNIEMIDGSVITGEVLSLSAGMYTVRSDSLGTIKLEESKVRAVRAWSNADSGSRRDNPSGSAGEARSLQEKMMNDQEIMGMIQSLQGDPEFKKVLEDPEVMKAVNAGDVTALMANPQFLKLLNNATVQDIQKKVK